MIENKNIIVDQRPIWIVILDRFRRTILLSVVFIVFAILLNMEGPSDLSSEGYKVLCLFFLCVSLWSTNIIPLSATSLLVIAAVPLLGIMDSSEVYSFFGNKGVFFILGAFIISGAMIGCGLSLRMTFWVIRHFGSSPSKLITAIYFFGAISSCFMSEHAVAAMMLPIVTEIVAALKLPLGRSVFAKAMFFSLAWGCIIGGAMTALGGGRVPLAVEILEKITNGQHTLGFLEYTQLSFPFVLSLLICGWILLIIVFKPDIKSIQPALETINKKSQEQGELKSQEIGIAIVMLVTLCFWFILGDQLGIANIALISCVTLFIFNLITWKTVERNVNWSIIILYGGAICLGEVMTESGAALWLAKIVFGNFAHSTATFLAVVAVLSILFTTFMSNSAVIAILLPPAVSMCETYGISPALATMTVILPSNFAFLLPIATPASAIAYSSRQISLREMITAGSALTMLGLICFLMVVTVFWPLIGFR
ncbi:MAG: SLC13 family permease [Nitrospinales bacterium]